jgi:hypothetical protein
LPWWVEVSDQGIKSRPAYEALRPDDGGRRHILLGDNAAFDKTAFARAVTPADFDERWTVAGRCRVIPDPATKDPIFRSTQHLLIALQRRLERETMGLRLYAAGDESFIWRIFGLAQEAGMSRAEVHLFVSGSSVRRVYCNHCRTINEGVRTNVVKCVGCGADLFVRDHFSRRLNAYAGVQVDAEVPGETIELQELYS